ncbi:MAG: AI-2E family transporter [Chitinophagales bacterium]
MENSTNSSGNNKINVESIIDICLRITALAALLIFCYKILEPFISLMIWSIVLAVSINPMFHSVKKLFRGRGALAAVSITVLFLAVLITPIVWMSISTGMSLENLGEQIKAGNVSIPPPSQSVASIPLIGKPIYDAWSLASTNLAQLASEYKDEIISVGTRIASMVASIGKGILLLAAAIIASGVLLAYGTAAGNFGRSLFVRLAGDRGKEMFSVAEVTVRNVTKGILGVAFIQAMFAGAGLFIASIPFAGLWTLLCVLLAMMQIGILPVSLGAIIYAWTNLSTGMAIFITVWMGFAGIIDNILKPIMLGRKAPVPMLVVFLGAIGGFINSGFIGLFTGAILLSLGYKLMMAWMYTDETTAAQ